MISDVVLFFVSDSFDFDSIPDSDEPILHLDPCAGCEPNWDCSCCPVMNPDLLGADYD